MGRDPSWYRKVQGLVGGFFIHCIESIDIASAITGGSGWLDLSANALFHRSNVVATGRYYRGT